MSTSSSFSRIPIAHVFNRDIYASAPRSTYIKEDLLLSYKSLKEIKSLSPENALNKLRNIIEVYNDNVAHINDSIKHRTLTTVYTYEQYCEDNQGRRNTSREDYHDAESKRIYGVMKKIDEEKQLSQLTYLFPDIATKITRAVERLQATSLPKLTPVHREHPHELFAPSLRRIGTPFEASQAAPAIEKIEETTSPTASKIDVAAQCNLTSDQVLGICCAPEWGAKPIAFTKSENGWNGQVPVNTEWKFVIIEKGQATHWEQHNNRRCSEQTQAFSVPTTEIKF